MAGRVGHDEVFATPRHPIANNNTKRALVVYRAVVDDSLAGYTTRAMRKRLGDERERARDTAHLCDARTGPRAAVGGRWGGGKSVFFAVRSTVVRDLLAVCVVHMRLRYFKTDARTHRTLGAHGGRPVLFLGRLISRLTARSLQAWTERVSRPGVTVRAHRGPKLHDFSCT